MPASINTPFLSILSSTGSTGAIATTPEPSVKQLNPIRNIRRRPYRSAAQFVSKVRNGAAAYASTDLPITEGQHWRQYGQLLDAHGPEVVEDVFRTWFWVADPHADPSLILDPAP